MDFNFSRRCHGPHSLALCFSTYVRKEEKMNFLKMHIFAAFLLSQRDFGGDKVEKCTI